MTPTARPSSKRQVPCATTASFEDLGRRVGRALVEQGAFLSAY